MAMAVLIGLWAAISPALGQQPDSQPPPPPKSDPPPSSKNEKDKKEEDQLGGTVGKSKLEKETGTVNDRIFEVLPNYGTVENANALPPLTTGQKFRIATASVFDWGAYPFNGALSAIAQAKNDPKEWGRGWDAYGAIRGQFCGQQHRHVHDRGCFPYSISGRPPVLPTGRGGIPPASISCVEPPVRDAHRLRA
jgi:hypothetical protein